MSVNPDHGPHRRPVGGAGTRVSSSAAVRWARATLARYAGRGQRSALGVAHERSVARSPLSLSALSNLSSSLPAVAAFQAAGTTPAKTGEDLRDRGKLDLSEAFIDASFS